MKISKLLLSIVCVLALTTALSFNSEAQTKVTKVYSKTNGTTDKRTYTYNTTDSKWYVAQTMKQNTLTTTRDSVVYNIDSVNVASYETGILEVQVLGMNDSLGIRVAGKKIVSYKSVAGTITLGTITDVIVDRDAGLQNTNLGGATFSITSTGTRIFITVKGKIPYILRWESLTSKQRLYL